MFRVEQDSSKGRTNASLPLPFQLPAPISLRPDTVEVSVFSRCEPCPVLLESSTVGAPEHPCYHCKSCPEAAVAGEVGNMPTVGGNFNSKDAQASF